MKYRQSNHKEIIISQIIAGVILVYLLSFLKPSLERFIRTEPINFKDFYLFCIYKVLFFFHLIFQLFLIIKLIYPYESKYNILNFKRKFHPFYSDKNGKFNFTLLLFFVSITIFLIKEYFEEDEHFYDVFSFLLPFFVFLLIMMRRAELNSFPVEFLKSNRVRIIVKYEDYINHKIADDEPHLTINQYFDVNLKSLPRNSSEKDLIEIKNLNTPINPALVYKIEDGELAQLIRDSYVLNAKLIEIKEEGSLEIELWFGSFESKLIDDFADNVVKWYKKNT